MCQPFLIAKVLDQSRTLLPYQRCATVNFSSSSGFDNSHLLTQSPPVYLRQRINQLRLNLCRTPSRPQDRLHHDALHFNWHRLRPFDAALAH